MEQQIGNVGQVTESFSAGVATVSGSVALPATAFGLSGQVQLSLALDASALIAFLAAKIGGAVPQEVATFLEAALKVA